MSTAFKRTRSIRGHEDYISSVAFSPDGRTLASGSWDKSVRLWDVLSGFELKMLVGHEEKVTSIAFSPDGLLVASSSRDNTVRLWDVTTGAELQVLIGHEERVNAVSFSPDSHFVASGSHDKSIRLWNVNRPHAAPRVLLGHSGSVFSVAFAPNGLTLASGSDDKSILLWDLTAGHANKPKILTRNETRVNSVVFSPDGSTLASGSNNKIIRLWDVATGFELRKLVGHEDWVNSVVFSPDGLTLASGSHDKTIRIWNVSTGVESRMLTVGKCDLYSISFSPDGKTLASGSIDKTIRLWDLSAGAELLFLRGSHEFEVNSVSFSHDGGILAGCINDRVVLWDIPSGIELNSLPAHQDQVNSVVFSSDGRILASCSQDKTIRLWNLSDLDAEPQVLIGHKSEVYSVCFSSNCRALASGGLDKTVRLWDVSTGTELNVFIGHKSEVHTVAFSPNARILASGGHDKTIHLWDIASNSLLKVLLGHKSDVYSVSFAPDGLTLVGGGTGEIVRLWEVSTGDELVAFSGHEGRINSVVFSPDGRFIISGSSDKTIRMWDISTEKLICSLYLPQEVHSIAFDPSARGLIALAYGRSIVLPCYSSLSRVLAGVQISNPADGTRRGEFEPTLLTYESWSNAIQLLFHCPLEPHNMASIQLLCGSGEPEWVIGLASDFLRKAQETHSPATIREPWLDILESALKRLSSKQTAEKALYLFHDQVTKPSVPLGAILGDLAAEKQLTEMMCDFFARLSLPAAPRSVSFFPIPNRTSKMITFPSESLIACPEIDEYGVKHHSAADNVVVEHCVIPIKDIGAPARRIKKSAAKAPRFNNKINPTDQTPSGLEDREDSSFIRQLDAAGNSDLFTSITVRAVVHFKWRMYGRKIFLRRFFIFLTGLFCLSAFSLLLSHHNGRTDFLTRSSTALATKISAIIVGLFSLYDALVELSQMRNGFHAYLGDLWNALHLSEIILRVLSVTFYFLDLDAVFVTLALATFTCWYGLLFYMQPFESTGSLVRMIFEIIKDIRWFLVVLAIAVIASTNAFYILVRREKHCTDHNIACSEVYVDPAEALFTMFNMLLLGNFETADYALGPYSILIKLLFVGSMLLVAIILLNLLIAIMGNSFSRINARRERELAALRAKILIELELAMSDADLQRKDWFPSYIHVILRQGQNKPTERLMIDDSHSKMDQIEGKIRHLIQKRTVSNSSQAPVHNMDESRCASRASFSGAEENLEGQMSQLDAKMNLLESKLEAHIERKMSQVDGSVFQLEAKISRLDSKIDELLLAIKRSSLA